MLPSFGGEMQVSAPVQLTMMDERHTVSLVGAGLVGQVAAPEVARTMLFRARALVIIMMSCGHTRLVISRLCYWGGSLNELGR